jgi:hypothetical protein
MSRRRWVSFDRVSDRSAGELNGSWRLLHALLALATSPMSPSAFLATNSLSKNRAKNYDTVVHWQQTRGIAETALERLLLN